ncbi:LysR family transcriptional regulator [Magnetospira sp. QH-2]|uniref:LysR family transcriptional regulator n=1 Tax=Magnetospira sp. (strain QH-2) TaxID=1288970 RepID=UPI0003E81A7A|nr:LysR family transcriptional regulator [Magnetospira sp. QH-2]CCQ75243.1 putative LysR family Transcriptional regulator [Magnetospira sp. QH-2]
MNLKSLRVFVYVIDEGTLARASERLNLSQPAASRLLSLLEHELGITLFFREKKRLVPTPEGTLFYAEAVRILASVDGIPAFFDQIKEDASVPLRIVCHSRIVNALVLPSIAKLSRRKPELRTKLEVYPRRNLARCIAQGLYDIGVGALPISTAELDLHRLCSCDVQIVLPKGHPLSKETALTTEQLSQLSYIAIDRSTLIRRIVDKALLQEGSSLEPHHEVSVGSAAYRLVLEGLGFTFADPVAVEEDLKQHLCFIPWDQTASIEFGLFLPKTIRRHHFVEGFIDCMHETVKEATASHA